MSKINKYLQRPEDVNPEVTASRYERFYLKENPFPAHPAVQKDSSDYRINGRIFEESIRSNELKKITENFLKVSQADLNHLRLGFLSDTSYIGRGNGKTAFLVNLVDKINEQFCLDISDKKNKCFAVYYSPKPGGATKTFSQFVKDIFYAIIEQDFINLSLATIYLNILYKQNKDIDLSSIVDDKSLIKCMLDKEWYETVGCSYESVFKELLQQNWFQNLPFIDASDYLFFSHYSMINQDSFLNYFNESDIECRIEFFFSSLIDLFLNSNFNGVYIFVDDFEKILNFQNAKQMRNFAFELRSSVFDGLCKNARIGFFNFFFVIHAGVHRLIKDAWNSSGMNNRVPLTENTQDRHVISFEKLTAEHTKSLLKKYLSEYRTEDKPEHPLFPFLESSIEIIGKRSEMNASKILRMSHNLIENAVMDDKVVQIDEDFINDFINKSNFEEIEDKIPSIDNIQSVDLQAKVSKRNGK